MKKARRRMERYRHHSLATEYNICRSKFRAEVKRVKIESWREFTSKITDPWEGLMRILGRLNVNKAQERTLCDIDGNFACDLDETLCMLSRQFYLSPMPHSEEHLKIEDEVKKELLHVDKGEDITVAEYRKALSEMSKATAPGADRITNCVIQVLSKDCYFESEYIKVFNVCMKLGEFPHAWKQAKIVLIPKPSTTLDTVKALRPISLTSVYSKLFERIMLVRILHYVEMSGNLSLSQHAYRKGGSTITAYEVFKFVQDALRDKQICIIVFLDISGAFDRTWHGGILYRLLQYGVPKYLVKWTKSFLTDRSAHFNAAGKMHSVKLDQGCPQGGVLSPVLWNVLFNDMLMLKTKSDQNFHLKVVGYADDAAVICRAANVKNASVILTNYLERIKDWADKNRVQFNKGKLNVLTINRGFSKAPAAVYYDKQLINEVSQYKYLGLLIDNKLSWKPHMDNVCEKLARVTRKLRGAVRENWGVRMNIMRMIFKVVFCPILLYGIAIWGWRAIGKNTCDKFDKVIRKFCIMSTRCFRSTSNVMLFRLMKTSNFATLVQNEVQRVSMLQLNLAKGERDHVFSKESAMQRRLPMSMDHFFFICKQWLNVETMNIMYENLLHHYSVKPSDWEITKTSVKEKTTAIWEGTKKEGWVIFTDASVSSYGAGWAFAVYRHGFCVNIQNSVLSKCSIFTAEAKAIFYAIQHTVVINGLKEKEVIEIRSDAQSVIKTLESTIIVDPMLRSVKDELREVTKKGINIVLKWVPSHSGIRENEMVDSLAKKAVDSLVVHETMWCKRDLKSCIKKRMNEMSKTEWSNVEVKILKLCFPEANCFESFLKSSPSVELCQIVSGHCRLNEFMCNKMAVISSASCGCNMADETVAHFLLSYPLYDQIREDIWLDFEPTFDFIRTKRFECSHSF